MSNISERIFQNAEVPFEIRKAFANAADPPEEFRGQVMMWRECVARAVMDALGYTGQSEPDRHNAILLEAQKWFTDSVDTAEVFENADLPLEITRACVIKNFAPLKVPQKTKGDSPPEKILLTKKNTQVKAKPQRKRKPNGKVDSDRRAKRTSSRKRVSGTGKKAKGARRVSSAAARRKSPKNRY